MSVNLLIKLHEIPEDGMPLKGQLSGELFSLKDSDPLSCDALDYDLKASIVSGNLLVKGKLSCEVYGQCDRCLRDTRTPVSVKDAVHYYESPGMEIDISDDIREAIVINFPTRLLCSEACKGLCPSCGADLNNNSCDCSTEDSFPGIWDDLDRLKK